LFIGTVSRSVFTDRYKKIFQLRMFFFEQDSGGNTRKAAIKEPGVLIDPIEYKELHRDVGKSKEAPREI
jgi:hypothetical protein